MTNNPPPDDETRARQPANGGTSTAEERPDDAGTDLTPSEGIQVGERTDEGDERPAGDPAQTPQQVPTQQDGLAWRGWILIGVVVVSFLVIPGMILLLPHAEGVVGAFGLTLRQAYLALPMIPALLLGAVAIWAALRSR